MEDEYEAGIVIDNGTCMTKAGFAGDDAPRKVFPTVITRPEPGTGRVYVGDSALAIRGRLSPQYPIKRGVLQSWDGMEKLWRHTFDNELRISPEEHPILLAEAPMTTKANREKTTHIMFETFSVPMMYMSPAASLALYSNGETTGLVIDIGGAVARAVPIYEGFILNHAINILDIGGADLTNYMMKLLNADGYSFRSVDDYIP